jgi:hypothetical protein
MVPLQLILGGAAGLDAATRCEAVFQKFDPPIVFGTYDEVKKHIEENPDLYPDYQAEHFIANCSFQTKRGSAASNVVSGYDMGQAPSYPAFDGQNPSTEHKRVTDAARTYDQGLNQAGKDGAKLGDRLEAAEGWTKDQLKENLQRSPGGDKRSRIKDRANMTPEEADKVAEEAAECIRLLSQQLFESQGIDTSKDTRLGGWKGKRRTGGATSG